ncbi:stage V sporulation protein AD [Defluviitalea phaphyphila]|uniref:stage V sporulation protein AD n=1 Tax=Defluviitalea phaphyphila TaxID=1473580 RepID=UPI000AEC543D|nr:stage V sporulation protein AD [Defluviitalea phaphyphila]
MSKHIGNQTIKFDLPPSIIETASIVGPKEGKGPLARYFDTILHDPLWGEKSWEKAESKLVNKSIEKVIEKANITPEDIQYIFAGDLLNQLTASTFGIRNYDIPFFGLFGACSTMAEGMMLGAMTIDGGFADYVIAEASSHFCSSEKQFRFPLELGTQRPLTASWTVTGSGAVIIGKNNNPPYITYITTGKIVDLGIKDPMNMGAAMAPAAADTIVTHFKDTGRTPNDYDLIITGDLGYVGKELALELIKKYNYDIENIFSDCGIEIFDAQTQDTHAGGSGCGCSAVTFCGYLYKEMKNNKWKRILFIPTGALMSPGSTQQGETIPGIAHAVVIENQLG